MNEIACIRIREYYSHVKWLKEIIKQEHSYQYLFPYIISTYVFIVSSNMFGKILVTLTDMNKI